MASKKSSARIKAQSLTTPKRAKPGKRVAATRTLPKKAKPAKRDASKYTTLPDERVTAQRTAKKTYKKSAVEHFIEAAAVTSSTPKAVQASEDTVTYQEAQELMKSPDVQTAIAGRRMTLAAECGITSQKVMKEFAAMGFSNMKRYANLLTADSVTTELAEMSDEDAAAIQELTTETYFDETEKKEVKRVKLKLYPKGPALEKMASHLGIKGFGGQLQKSNSPSIGMQTTVAPDGTVITTAIVQQLSDEELYRIAAGEDDTDQYDERTE